MIWSWFGPPKRLRSDNGTEFKGPVLDLCKKYGVQIVNGTPWAPWVQGKVSVGYITLKLCILTYY